jgi:predicted NBD/HSP70 family sugar kinase
MQPGPGYLPPRRSGRQGLVRDLDLRAVFERLATFGPASRTDLARVLGLSRTAVGRAVDELRHAGLVVESERVQGGLGRPSTPLRVRSDAAVVAGVSIRSRSLRVRLADLDGAVLSRSRSDRSDDDARTLAHQVAGAIAALAGAHAAPLAAVTIGISGVWDARAERVYAAPNLALLEGLDARSLFAEALEGIVHDDRVLVDNDVNLAAAGEHAHGAVMGVDDVFYLSLGSGVGGAAIVAGRLQRGARGFAGEVGYLPVHADGGWRTLEGIAARSSLDRFARSAGLDVAQGDVFAALDSGGPAAELVIERVGRVLGQALVAVVATLDPSLIVLGGDVGRRGGAWTDRLRRELAAHLPVVPETVTGALGADASLIGAVHLGRARAREALVHRGEPP